MIISVVFFQSIGDAKKAGILVIFRQLVVFVPSIIILPRAFGIDAVWYTQPLVDFIMTAISAVLIVLTVKRFPHKDAETIQSSLNKL